jgi:hypothetical protein
MRTEVEETPVTGLDTPHGRLVRPQGFGLQALALVGAFAGGPALGWAVGRAPGDLSETARTFLYVPFVLVFFLGYAAWLARLKVIAFQGLGVPILWALFQLIVHRRKPRSIGDVLPTREKLLEMAVRAQAAGASFRRVGWLVGVAAGFVAALFASATGPAVRFSLVTGATVAWGYALAVLARRGWLPIPEQG